MEAIGCFPKILSFGLEYVNRHSTRFVNKIRNSMGGIRSLKVNNYYKKGQSLLNLFSKSYKRYDKGELPCVYKIPCHSCGKYYIGETGRTFAIRKQEHIQRKDPNSALYIHSQDASHRIDFDHGEILLCESNSSKRKILEALINKSTAHFEGNICRDLLVF